MTGLTQNLARFTISASVTPGMRAAAARSLPEVTTAAAAEASHPAVAAVAELAASLATPPESPVPGTTTRYAAPWSALLTATAAATTRPVPGDAQGDARGGPQGRAPGVAQGGTPRGAAGAPGELSTWGSDLGGYACAVVPAALAVGAAEGLGMAAVVDAVAVGLDVARRLHEALGGALGEFEPVASIGHLAAVAAAGRLLGLSPEAAAHAYGISGTQAAGFTGTATGPIGALQIGKAAYDAVEAAYLARAGYTAGLTGIEGRRGFAAILAPGADLTTIDLDTAATGPAPDAQPPGSAATDPDAAVTGPATGAHSPGSAATDPSSSDGTEPFDRAATDPNPAVTGPFEPLGPDTVAPAGRARPLDLGQGVEQFVATFAPTGRS